MSKRKGPVLMVDLDGIIAQWQRWGGTARIGLPVGHNLIQVRRWREKNPKGRILVRVSEKPRGDINLRPEIARIRKWLKANDVPYDGLSIELKRPRFDEHWDAGK